MPSDVVTIVVSTGIGVSVIAGVLSGVCYILAHGFTRKRSRRPLLQWYCAVCGNYLRSRLVDRVQAVICLECEERVCKLRCAKKEYMKRGWICYNCLKQPSFLKGLINSIRHLHFNNLKQLTYKENSSTKQITVMEKDIEAIRKREKDQIRDFIEKIVSTILGGNIDDASVFRVYNDKYYDTLFERYHQELKNAITDLSSALHISIINAPDVVEQSPSTAHTNLKRIIKKLLEEASYLPNLKRAVDQPNPSNENERTYEELLATAIVNKVVSKSQRKRTSSAASNSSRVSTSSNKDSKEYFFGEETLETKWNPADLETTSNSSIDEYLQSDSSHGSTKYVDRVSLTIRQRIEEVPPAIVDEDVGDNFSPFSDSKSLTDDPNWHLQKRQFHGTHSPVPVPMLVPNPVSTAKVLIGDKEADETSDLSDAASEYDEHDGMEATGVHSYMLESKMIIGGKNVIDRIENNNTSSDEETSADSGVKEDRDDLSEKDNMKPKADVSLDDENVEDVSLTSVNSNVERDSEYLEKYASLPRTIIKSPSPRSQKILHRQYSTSVEEDETLLKNSDTEKLLDDTTETPAILEGSYSKKEKEKWKNPIEMPNNPYSKENIEKRSRSRQIFGRDYFPKETSLPSRQKKDQEVDLNIRPSEAEENLYRAVPVAVQNTEFDEEEVQEAAIEGNNDSLQPSEITSDSDLGLINCYDVENSKVYHQSFDLNNDTMMITVNTQGLLYNPDATEHILEIDDCIHPEIIIDEDNLNTPMSLVLNEEKSIEIHPEINSEENKAFVKTVPKIKPRSFVNKHNDLPKQNFNEFSIEEKTQSENQLEKPGHPAVNKKSDNTIIKKIYCDPVVRSFALSNREENQFVIDKTLGNTNSAVSNQHSGNLLATETDRDKKEYLDPQETSFDDNNNNTFSLEYSDNDSAQQQESDIDDLKQKRLVASQLNKFSKSAPSLSRLNLENRSTNGNITNLENSKQQDNFYNKLPPETFVSVKDLKKIFENNETPCYKDKPVHSLTARSLSKPMKEKLKNWQ